MLRALAWLCLLLVQPAAAAGLVLEHKELPVTIAGTATALETLLVLPPGGPAPLAILSHGTPRDGAERRRRAPHALLPQAQEFARRGWAVAIVMRRGYGTSPADYAESNGACATPDYMNSARASAADLRAALAALAGDRRLDQRRLLAVGVSAGGFASLALAAEPPPGLLGVVSFAGGRGSPRPEEVCAPDRLAAAFAALGRSARVPSLWIYAENDRYFSPALAGAFFQAFTAAGGRAELVIAPAFGEDGHTLFSRAGIAHWTPYVERFLARHRLTVLAEPLPLPRDQAEPPASLAEPGRKSFADYLAAPPHKAFATGSGSSYGWVSARRTREDAAREALETCRRHSSRDCTVAHGR
ncbi:MAG: alpha/beta hydrolase [Thalassobaculales bacterium]